MDNSKMESRNPNTRFVKKQMENLKKEVQQLSKDFGVDACFVHVNDSSSSSPPKIVTWPENQDTVRSMIERYRSIPEEERKKRTFGVPDFLKDKINKSRSDLAKLKSENEKLDKDNLLHKMGSPNLDGLGIDELLHILHSIEDDIEQVRSLKMKGNGSLKEETPLKMKRKGSFKEETPLKMKKKGSLKKGNLLKMKKKGSLKEETPLKRKRKGSFKEETPLKMKKKGSLKQETPLKMKGKGSLKKETPLKMKGKGSLKEEAL
ncbi:uncharacterized protein LOC143846634 [Tasmannia lanceolata]|uniref:uncharacterized protein LOC143846634 n=1 Tax=Tasmannia lanceolata TaxID=3420 RepID=UPI004062B537